MTDVSCQSCIAWLCSIPTPAANCLCIFCLLNNICHAFAAQACQLSKCTCGLQSLSLGLGEQWEKVKTAYAQANRALGDIVKVAFKT